jgi:hypothetical protein
MSFLRKAKVAAFKARLQLREAERRRIVDSVTKSQVRLAQIAEHVDRVENDIHVLTRELKLLEVPEQEEPV